MIGLDTNVLVRYLTQDDPQQASIATCVIQDGADRGETFFVCSPVMCELVWVLDAAYGHDRDEIVEVLEQVLRTRQFVFEDKDLLWQALSDYREQKGDFADYLIGRRSREAGCDRTVTFDRKLRESPHFSVL